MNVILLEKVNNLGERGDIKKVKDGYARNYLIPNGIALEANRSNTANIENLRRNWKKKENRERAVALEIKRSISNKSPYIISMKAGPEGKLYGSVTNQDLAAAIHRETDVEIDRRKINMHHHIKMIGEYSISVSLYSEVDADIVLRVTDENGNFTPPEEEIGSEVQA